MDSGRDFQMYGPATNNAVSSPNLLLLINIVMTHLTLLGALVVTNSVLRHLTNWRFIIIIIISRSSIAFLL